MTTKLSVDDLREYVTGDLHRTHDVVVCDWCDGTGYKKKEELTDYHKREYHTSVSECYNCKGDGRMIVTKEWMTFHTREEVNKMPYAEFSEFVEPNLKLSQWFRYRLDRSDERLEREFPELAEISYDKYDKLAEVCRSMKNIKGTKYGN